MKISFVEHLFKYKLSDIQIGFCK